jgi:hypothetical protein
MRFNTLFTLATFPISTLALLDGKYCGTTVIMGNKLTCVMDVKSDDSTVMFEFKMNGDEPKPHIHPVPYSMEGENFILDPSNVEFRDFLRVLIPVFPLTASNIESVYDDATDILHSKIVLPLFPIENILTKYKCSHPMFVGTYKSDEDFPVVATVLSTERILKIDLGYGDSGEETLPFTIEADGRLVFETEVDFTARIEGDKLIVQSGEDTFVLTWKE